MFHLQLIRGFPILLIWILEENYILTLEPFRNCEIQVFWKTNFYYVKEISIFKMNVGIMKAIILYIRPRLSRGKALASRLKVNGFEPSWDHWIFSGHTSPEYSSWGRDFKLWVSSLNIFEIVKERQAWKKGRRLRKK